MDYYDSPTFLGQKDIYLVGLTLIQLLGLVGIGFMTFLMLMLFPMSTVVRLILVLPLTGASGFLLFGKIAGLSVPVYAVSALASPFRRVVYEETLSQSLDGTEAWLRQQQIRAAGAGEKKRGRLGFGRLSRLRGKAGEAAEAAGGQQGLEARAEVEKGLVEGSVAAQQWVREGVSAIFRGR